MTDYAELVELIRSFACNQYPQCEDCEMVMNGHECRSAIERQAADVIEELQAAVPKWISVEERLPDYGERVLIMFKPLDEEECISIGWLTQYGFECYDDSVYFFRSVTHWMPLPEPPMED